MKATHPGRCALNIDSERLYKWQKEALTPMVARGAELDPAIAAKLRQLRAINRLLRWSRQDAQKQDV